MTYKIKMPRLGVNDDYVTLVSWSVRNGDWVEKDQKIAVIETSKETNEVISEYSGKISLLVEEGEDIVVGNIIACIGETGIVENKNHKDYDEIRITEKAKKIARENKIAIELLPKGKLIRERDILKLIEKPYSIEKAKDNKVLIYGGGGFGKIAIEILKNQHIFEIYGVIDSNFPKKREIMGIPVLGNDEDIGKYLKEGYSYIFNAVGFLNKTHWRKQPYDKLKNWGFKFFNIIHNSASIEPSVHMEVGTLVCAGAIIGSDVIIGNNCIINSGVVISHDCIISDSCHISSGAVLAGSVVVGENTLIGQNCTVYSDVRIGKNVTIQNGCHIFKDIKDGEVVYLN